MTTTATRTRSTRRMIATAGLSAIALATIAGTGLGVAHAAGLGTGAASVGQTIVIDSNTNPTGAVQALKMYPQAANQAFTPTSQPVFAQTNWSAVTDENGNPAAAVTGNASTGQSVTETLGVTHSQGSSWSLGGSIEASVGFDLLDTVDAEVSTTFTASHTWESDESDSESITVTAKPGKTVWIEASNSTATFTGTFNFDINGVHYEVENVTMTQAAATDADSMAATTYKVMEINSLSAGLPSNTTGGLRSMASLPKLRSYIASGH